MKRYIVSDQILGIMLSKLFLEKKSEVMLKDLNCTIRSISYQAQRDCQTVIDFSGKDIYQFIYNNEKYFCLQKDRIIISEYLETEMQMDYEGVKDIFDTKFIAGFPNDVERIIDQNLIAI